MSVILTATLEPEEAVKAFARRKQQQLEDQNSRMIAKISAANKKGKAIGPQDAQKATRLALLCFGKDAFIDISVKPHKKNDWFVCLQNAERATEMRVEVSGGRGFCWVKTHKILTVAGAE